MGCESITFGQASIVLAVFVVLCGFAFAVLVTVGNWVARFWLYFIRGSVVWLVFDDSKICSVFDNSDAADSYCQSMAGSAEGVLRIEQATLHSAFKDMTT